MPIDADKLHALALKWANGNEDAARLLAAYANLTRQSDDVADGDAEQPVPVVANMLRISLMELPDNAFFRQHAAHLNAAVLTAIMSWELSEEYRRAEDEKTRMFGFVYREAVSALAWHIAYLTGGYGHAMKVARELHKVSIISSDETLQDWESE